MNYSNIYSNNYVHVAPCWAGKHALGHLQKTIVTQEELSAIFLDGGFLK